MIRLILLCCLLIIGCGKRETIIEREVALDAPSTPLPQQPETTSLCALSALGTEAVLTCNDLIVLLDGNILANTEINSTQIIMVASKRNGGTGGSKFYDANLTLDEAKDLALPNTIPAVGNAGNGQKLYIKFNDEIDCAWFSHAQSEYRNPRCFEGASRNGGSPSGFSDGDELFLTTINDFTTLEMQVNGASGNGVMTTATATFEIE
jgi:hypothetical protein